VHHDPYKKLTLQGHSSYNFSCTVLQKFDVFLFVILNILSQARLMSKNIIRRSLLHLPSQFLRCPGVANGRTPICRRKRLEVTRVDV
jgi:hypothetical protein